MNINLVKQLIEMLQNSHLTVLEIQEDRWMNDLCLRRF